jgi:hypothetical protein
MHTWAFAISPGFLRTMITCGSFHLLLATVIPGDGIHEIFLFLLPQKAIFLVHKYKKPIGDRAIGAHSHTPPRDWPWTTHCSPISAGSHLSLSLCTFCAFLYLPGMLESSLPVLLRNRGASHMEWDWKITQG